MIRCSQTLSFCPHRSSVEWIEYIQCKFTKHKIHTLDIFVNKRNKVEQKNTHVFSRQMLSKNYVLIVLNGRRSARVYDI